MRHIRAIALALVLLAAGCNQNNDANDGAARAQGRAGSSGQGDLPQGSEPVKLNPADFSVNIDNPYWPMASGDRWVYRETGEGGPELRGEVTVTDRTRRIANGIEARVVHDVVTEDGQLVEVTDDWYA